MSLNFINAGKKRGVPMNWKSLKSFTASYSQMGEDIYLSYLFGPTKNTGKYLDIGGYDPIQYSNTYLLYQRGWTGIAIEPNHSFKKEWTKYRPKDLFINIGISNHEQDLYLAEHKTYPAMNKLCNANEKEDLQRNNEFIVTKRLETKKLDTLIQENNFDTFDLLSIDCEGMDLDVLTSIDLLRHTPSVICIEDREAPLHGCIHDHLVNYNYIFSAAIGISRIYIHKSFQ
jgi:FkbM family methyltransferase